MNVRLANKNDLEQLAVIINSVYRGEASKKNWTTEAHWILNQRIHSSELEEFIREKRFTLLVAEDNNKLLGCVKLEVEESHRVFLGLLTVASENQKSGVGRYLVKAAENFTKKSLHQTKLYMWVLSNRPELLAWYERQGYKFINETKPWQKEWGPTLIPLEFMAMSKDLDV